MKFYQFIKDYIQLQLTTTFFFLSQIIPKRIKICLSCYPNFILIANANFFYLYI